ncbi:type I restriction-modification system subunit M [Bifidobacterium sp. ESL0745]|uniref:type I restriction-modification system subunit M n=1 Tax=Bifidobacterium sp. ESL0745 TaxID=2983226 RepID=UPI0023FA19CB|nr:type I restriction-modification system subunit M [Bifidobacterium sp. ESL0745]MDF7665352.1 type I restriction-modification system subunit M [Bifidobacterium sp. ESL0745]
MATQDSKNQRDELHKAIWNIAEKERNAVDSWDFKAYIFCFLFYRFISEDLAEYIDKGEHETGNESFSYVDLSDEEAEVAREDVTKEKGFFMLPSQLFQNVAKNPEKDDKLNITVKNIFSEIERSSVGTASEDDFKGLFDDVDVTSTKLGANLTERNARLAGIISGIRDLDFGNIRDADIDLFGDAYEYLMNMYASNAGKSGGEYFTPQEVAELLARIVIGHRTYVNKVYDPACGSGSLLLRFAKILGQENVRQGFFGQEKNPTTYNLARINMFLHHINFDRFDIAQGDTLINPKHWDKQPFDAIVSNPPYSTHWKGDSDPTLINDPRFAPAGVLAPKGYADLAFTMHMFSWLSTDGTAAIVEFPGVLYRGGAEEKIREYLVHGNYVSAVIQLPANLFFGVTIATCILVLSKSKSDDKVLFVDASEQFGHVGNKNKLMPENIDKIASTVVERNEEKYFSKLVGIDEIGNSTNHYNLSVGTWVEKKDTTEKVDIVELNQRIGNIVHRENDLRQQIDFIIEDLEG